MAEFEELMDIFMQGPGLLKPSEIYLKFRGSFCKGA